MVQLRIVVARYNEDVTWSSRYPCVIYNKGTPIPNSIELPNIGREAHTYLYHILQNYNELDDYTAFLQGNPFDHSPNLFKHLDRFSGFDELPDFIYLSETILPTNNSCDFFHPIIPLQSYYDSLFKPSTRKNFLFGAGAQFLVSKKAIQSIPLEVYKHLYDTLISDPTVYGAHALERLWGVLFTSVVDNKPELRL
jgi:hypothetical protein